jgi:hypothetical protein
MMTHLFTEKTIFGAKSVDPNGIGGGRKEDNINNQVILKSLLTYIMLIPNDHVLAMEDGER